MRAAAAVWILAFAACPGRVDALCNDDDDCGDGVCLDGRCAPRGAAGEGEGEGEAGEGEGEGEGEEAAGEGEGEGEGDDVACDSVVFVDNVVGGDVVGVPARVVVTPPPPENPQSAFRAGSPELRAPIEIADGAVWLRVDAAAGERAAWCLSRAAPTPGDPWGDFTLVLHCEGGRQTVPVGALTPTPNTAPGVAGEACVVGARTVVANAAAVTAGDGVFLHALVRAQPAAEPQPLLSRRAAAAADAAGDLHLYLAPEGQPQLFTPNDVASGVDAVADDGWHDVSFTVTDGAPTLFVDDERVDLAGEDLVGLIEDADDAPVLVGSDDVGGRVFGGVVDELLVSARPRSPSFVRALHRGARGLLVSSTPASVLPLVSNGALDAAWVVAGGNVAVVDDTHLQLDGARLERTLPAGARRVRVTAVVVGASVGVVGDDGSGVVVVGGAGDSSIVVDGFVVASAAASVGRVEIVVDRDAWRVAIDEEVSWEGAAAGPFDGTSLLAAPRVTLVADGRDVATVVEVAVSAEAL